MPNMCPVFVWQQSIYARDCFSTVEAMHSKNVIEVVGTAFESLIYKHFFVVAKQLQIVFGSTDQKPFSTAGHFGIQRGSHRLSL